MGKKQLSPQRVTQNSTGISCNHPKVYPYGTQIAKEDVHMGRKRGNTLSNQKPTKIAIQGPIKNKNYNSLSLLIVCGCMVNDIWTNYGLLFTFRQSAMVATTTFSRTRQLYFPS